MTTLREAALQRLTDVQQEIEAALAEPEQEPVAWLRLRDGKLAVADGGNFGNDWMPLYTAPHGIGGQDES